MGFQYPLLFPYGEDGYRDDVLHRATTKTTSANRTHLTIKEWLCFRIQSRIREAETLLRSRRLFQQFLVVGYLMLESERLSFIRMNQTKLRVDELSNLSYSSSTTQSQGSNKGKELYCLQVLSVVIDIWINYIFTVWLFVVMLISWSICHIYLQSMLAWNWKTYWSLTFESFWSFSCCFKSLQNDVSWTTCRFN